MQRKRIKKSDTSKAILVTYTDIAQVGTTFGQVKSIENPVNCFTDKVKHAEGVFLKADYEKHKHNNYIKAEVARIEAGIPVDIQKHKKLIQHGPSDAASAFKTMRFR